MGAAQRFAAVADRGAVTRPAPRTPPTPTPTIDFQLEHPEPFRLEPQAEVRSKNRGLPPGWQRHRSQSCDYAYHTAQRWENRPDGSILDARVDPMGTVDGGREWTVELLGPANSAGQRETIGAWEGTYKGSLVDGAEAAERCIAEHVPAIPAKEPT